MDYLMPSDLEKEFSGKFDEFKVNLIKGTGGVYEIFVNDQLQIFSKKQTGRFPKSSYEITKTINDAIDERRLG